MAGKTEFSFRHYQAEEIRIQYGIKNNLIAYLEFYVRNEISA